jgi:hypothetical protein
MTTEQQYPTLSSDELKKYEEVFQEFLEKTDAKVTFDDVCAYLKKHDEQVAWLRKGSVYVPIPHFSTVLNIVFDALTAICKVKETKAG